MPRRTENCRQNDDYSVSSSPHTTVGCFDELQDVDAEGSNAKKAGRGPAELPFYLTIRGLFSLDITNRSFIVDPSEKPIGAFLKIWIRVVLIILMPLIPVYVLKLIFFR